MRGIEVERQTTRRLRKKAESQSLTRIIDNFKSHQQESKK